MALRDQPYLPLYIQDIMTDEKLNECSAATHGIYIKGIMCLMHKSEEYGKILLKQKYKQTESISLNFGKQISKHTPYSPEEISKAIDELLREDVCQLSGDYLCQKRMIKDNSISEARSNAGKKGGGNPNFVSKLVKTKKQTNTENEYKSKNEDVIVIKNEINKREEDFKKEVNDYFLDYTPEMLNDFFNYWSESDSKKKKMRFELEKTWDMSKRLDKWYKNSIKFNQNGKSTKPITENQGRYNVGEQDYSKPQQF